MNKAQANQFKKSVFAAVDEAVSKMGLDDREIEVRLHLDVQDTVAHEWPEEG